MDFRGFAYKITGSVLMINESPCYIFALLSMLFLFIFLVSLTSFRQNSLQKIILHTRYQLASIKCGKNAQLFFFFQFWRNKFLLEHNIDRISQKNSSNFMIFCFPIKCQKYGTQNYAFKMNFFHSFIHASS